jgi:magnesium transporter
VAPQLRSFHLNDPVTDHLRRDFAAVDPSLTVGEALARLRGAPPRGDIVYFYAIDAAGRLAGVVPSRAFILSQPDRPVADLLVRDVVTLPAAATMGEAGELFVRHRFLALPVVDGERRLVGVLDVPFSAPESGGLSEGTLRDELFQRIGVRLSRAPRASPLAAFARRFPWLGCNMAGGLLAAFLCGAYQGVLDRAVALAFFIPVVLNLAESVSAQSVSLTLEAFHGHPPTWRSLLQALRGELATGLLLGGASGLAVGLVGLVWLWQWRLAACLLGGIAGGVAGSAVLGVALPTLLRLVKMEPRVAAGPVALAAADVLTILLYLNLALWLLGGA